MKLFRKSTKPKQINGVDINRLIPGETNAHIGMVRGALNQRYGNALCPMGTTYDENMQYAIGIFQQEIGHVRTSILTKDELCLLADEYQLDIA